jgi:hypothetical protein
MADEILRRAARAITDLRKLAKVLNDAGYPMASLRLQGFAGVMKALEGEFIQAQAKADAEQVPPSDEAKRAS